VGRADVGSEVGAKVQFPSLQFTKEELLVVEFRPVALKLVVELTTVALIVVELTKGTKG